MPAVTSSAFATDFPGAAAVLRFSDAEEFTDLPRGPWWPDDVDDFRADIDDRVGLGEMVLQARADLGCPDVDVRATVLRMLAPPWANDPDSAADTLVIHSHDGLTVLSYPDAVSALAAFHQHVATRQAAGDAYDYVTAGGPRRTSWPPAPEKSRLRWHAGQHGDIGTVEGIVTITLDDNPLIGIDLHSGQVLAWPDGDTATPVHRITSVLHARDTHRGISDSDSPTGSPS